MPFGWFDVRSLSESKGAKQICKNWKISKFSVNTGGIRCSVFGASVAVIFNQIEIKTTMKSVQITYENRRLCTWTNKR